MGSGFYKVVQHLSSGDAGRCDKEDKGQFLPRMVAAVYHQIDGGGPDRSVDELERVGLTIQKPERWRVEVG